MVTDYNKPVHLIAERVADALGIRYMPGLLRKIRVTQSQRELNRNYLVGGVALPENNLAGSFVVEGSLGLLQHVNLLVLDDVTTSGSSLYEVGNSILQAYPAVQLFYITIAKAGV